jgi:hypothetical protein
LGERKFDPTLLRVMVGFPVAATKEYQTSYLAVPLQAAGTPDDSVALTTVPAVLVQVEEELRAIAFAQLSLAGA